MSRRAPARRRPVVDHAARDAAQCSAAAHRRVRSALLLRAAVHRGAELPRAWRAAARAYTRPACAIAGGRLLFASEDVRAMDRTGGWTRRFRPPVDHPRAAMMRCRAQWHDEPCCE